MAETDLISRQAAIRRYCGEHCGCEPQDCGLTILQDGSEDCDFVRFLKEEPSRDIAPSAQPERKRGKWIEYDTFATISGRCSVCGWEAHLYEDDVVGMNYCPNCGAKMDGFEEE
jgi:hypothetical protein